MFHRYLPFACLMFVASLGVTGAAESSPMKTGLTLVAGTARSVSELNPSAFMRMQNIGSIYRIDKLNRRLVMNDMTYSLADSVRVYLSKARWGTLSDIHRGDLVKLKLMEGKDGAREVTEIRVLRRGRDGA